MEAQQKSQLSLVSNEDNLEGYEPFMLSTQEFINSYWPFVEPLFERCVDNEGIVSDLSDLKGEALRGETFVFVVHKPTEEGPDIKLAVAVQVNSYTNYSTANIVALGGESLTLFHSKFWGALKGWMYITGLRAVEADVSPAMERVLKKFGFERESVKVRLPLTGE